MRSNELKTTCVCPTNTQREQKIHRYPHIYTCTTEQRTHEHSNSKVFNTDVGEKTYSTAICLADVDTDGYSNGEELGDACCYGWTSGNVDAAKGVSSTGGTDTRISNPRDGSSMPTTWSEGPITTGADIKKFRTASPEAFAVTTAARDVRILCSNHFYYNHIYILTLFNPYNLSSSLLV